ncbi:hypothetical protein ACO0LD_12455 [Undibacterium sp. Ji83W]|uniref:hypothetical protein n=1 Tax=Undibacterium sp. Ji83W TaxID=3413043 RepID=UPI003BEF7F00
MKSTVVQAGKEPKAKNTTQITYTEASYEQQGTGYAITVAALACLFDWQRQIRQDANPVQ